MDTLAAWQALCVFIQDVVYMGKYAFKVSCIYHIGLVVPKQIVKILPKFRDMAIQLPLLIGSELIREHHIE